jgi:hypothetical protein
MIERVVTSQLIPHDHTRHVKPHGPSVTIKCSVRSAISNSGIVGTLNRSMSVQVTRFPSELLATLRP